MSTPLNPAAAVKAVLAGESLCCTADDYPQVRAALLAEADRLREELTGMAPVHVTMLEQAILDLDARFGGVP